MGNERTRGAVRIGDLVVDAGARTVMRGSQPIELPKLSFDLLLALVEAAPDALSTEDLMERVWTGRVVSPQTVAKRVELLRQALGDDATEPRYVMLVRGYGYRLAQDTVKADRPRVRADAGSTEADQDSDAIARHDSDPDRNAAARTDKTTRPRRVPLTALLAAAVTVAALALFLNVRDRAPANPPERSVAVLPFEALGDSAEDQWFADGLTEEIAHALARTGELKVTGRMSAEAYRESSEDAITIGKALGVGHLLEGTVRRQDDRLRIVTRLTRTADGFQQWSEVFETSAENSAGMHQQVAQRVAERFELATGPSGIPDAAVTSSNPEAYALYLQAVSLSAYPLGSDLKRAQELIEQVLDLDPGFAPGWTRLAIVHGQRLFSDRTYGLDQNASIQLMRSAIDRALAIDPAQGEAYNVLAGIAWVFEQDTDRAARLLEQALRLDPWNLNTVRQAQLFSRAIGDLEQSRDLAAYVIRRDPLCASCRTAYAGILACLGEHEAARQELTKVREEDIEWPLDYDHGQLALRLGKLDAAEQHFARIEVPSFRRLGEIHLLLARGDHEQARQQLERHIADHPGHAASQAEIAAKLGDPTLTVNRYRALLPRRYVFAQTGLCAPRYRAFNTEPEWQALMIDLGRNPDGSPAITLDVPPLPGDRSGG
jgi:TolB-like protein/DNA-binding winged helix-turn-helix (wHTH) protein